MTLEILGISVLWIFLFGYVIVASIDFGAGFFNAYSLLIGKNHILTNIIKRYLSPVWEVTNVFLVFFFVGIVGFFPQTAFYYGTILLIPVSISLVLLAIRGSYYAFESYGTRGHIGYTLTYGVAGLLIPASLSVVFAIAGGGYVDLVNGQPVLNYWTLYTSPFAWSIVVLSIAAVLYISAVFLTWYAHKANDIEATKLMRKYALLWAAPLMISALGIMYEMKSINPESYSHMVNLWWMFAISAILFIITVFLISMRKKYGLAVALLIAQFAVAFFAYGIAQYPYLLYPYLTIYDGFTSTQMAIALIIAFILGLCLLLPSLYLLMKLFLFNKNYVTGKEDNHA
ncbi:MULTISPECIES: cytochrome d ubiquinol oxidase subunit II [Lysinibacillus]|uniref:Cytochrome bd-I ubiquinol oxidase subunit 2 apoprotein n=1 Tax=Lysinibacillus fusiformis TaxID=28031 RepID=A0A1H9P9Y5_9BACI|nr:cytochrome d ubiquinol oxidase subunit II [Lysinibacillus fusiformis]SCY70534.1 cytochrome bd-I ubiquinol oxidase subunit 2 apoprotein [Lysinibacillus fusiformis]SEO19382.1 cytochrome bd-I ubiquinol oxidase subunit 2 apoprotein [Lysinibacillus fusiformis]SER44921.1 cytochrome bd-I ubiquinol oxidase subunit 2 apoprotein [Lysinibacillus fusiformis]HAU34866.1 cytochrome D ubiquinol oxidase subunit II [Lysinibacillus sp.]